VPNIILVLISASCTWGFPTEKNLNQEDIQPSVTTVTTETATPIFETKLPEAIGQFINGLFTGQNTETEKKWLETNNKLIDGVQAARKDAQQAQKDSQQARKDAQEAQNLAKYSSFLKSKH